MKKMVVGLFMVGLSVSSLSPVIALGDVENNSEDVLSVVTENIEIADDIPFEGEDVTVYREDFASEDDLSSYVSEKL